MIRCTYQNLNQVLVGEISQLSAVELGNYELSSCQFDLPRLYIM
jgi:hypothetical protein